jgi:hypothetical protein
VGEGVGVGVGLGVGVGVGEGVALGVGVGPPDGVGVGAPLGDALGLADPDGFTLGDAEGFVLPLGDGVLAGLLPDGAGVGVERGASASGRAELFGRAAKNRGGRLKVGTSSQKGACGSSEK